MSKLLIATACGALLGTQVLAQPSAPTVSFSPAIQTIGIGALTTVDVTITGLDGPLALGAYDFDFGYNPSVVSVVDIAFPAPPNSGLHLGVFGSWTGWSAGGGAGHLDEISLEDAQALSDTQAGSFILAHIQVQGAGLGVSALDFIYVALSDQNGVSIDQFGTRGASVEVVPETRAFALWAALGLLGFGMYRRTKRN